MAGLSLLGVLLLCLLIDWIWPYEARRRQSRGPVFDPAYLAAEAFWHLIPAGILLAVWGMFARERWTMKGFAWRFAVCVAAVLYLTAQLLRKVPRT